MSKHDTLTDYLRRARTDAGFRAHLLDNARYTKSAFGWSAFFFAALAVGPSVYDGLRYGMWTSSTSILAAVSCAFSLLIYDKFGDRIAMLTSMDDVPNQLPDPTSPSVTPPAGAGVAPSVAADH
jgi:hypothetical protein